MKENPVLLLGVGRCASNESALREAAADPEVFLRKLAGGEPVSPHDVRRFAAIAKRLQDGEAVAFRSENLDVGVWSVI